MKHLIPCFRPVHSSVRQVQTSVFQHATCSSLMLTRSQRCPVTFGNQWVTHSLKWASQLQFLLSHAAPNGAREEEFPRPFTVWELIVRSVENINVKSRLRVRVMFFLRVPIRDGMESGWICSHQLQRATRDPGREPNEPIFALKYQHMLAYFLIFFLFRSKDCTFCESSAVIPLRDLVSTKAKSISLILRFREMSHISTQRNYNSSEWWNRQ